MFSLRSVVQLVKSVMKVAVIIWIIYTSVKELLVITPDILATSMDRNIEFMLEKTMSMVYKICLFFITVAILDFSYQKYDYEKKLRMTKQEVKDEYKQTEGDPLIKSRIRERQRKMSLNRMIQQVHEADVVVRNPTHYAVALKYDIDKDFAPMVLAKGQDHIAMRIIQEAEKHKVPIMEDKPLAQALYKAVELNDYIPVEFYQAVAEILAWVYNSRGKARGRYETVQQRSRNIHSNDNSLYYHSFACVFPGLYVHREHFRFADYIADHHVYQRPPGVFHLSFYAFDYNPVAAGVEHFINQTDFGQPGPGGEGH